MSRCLSSNGGMAKGFFEMLKLRESEALLIEHWYTGVENTSTPKPFATSITPETSKLIRSKWKICWSLYTNPMVFGRSPLASSLVNYLSCGSSGSSTTFYLPIIYREPLTDHCLRFILTKSMALLAPKLHTTIPRQLAKQVHGRSTTDFA